MNSSAAINLAVAPPRPGDWADLSQRQNLRGWSARVWWLLWQMLLPADTQRTRPTRAGAVLVAVAFGIGLAAYNNANNVLFMALSLLLSCLVLSGVLSWINFRGLRWRLSLPAHWRAGEPGPARLELSNAKKMTPTYNLLFHARARRLAADEPLRLPDRLDAGGTMALDWIFQPTERGRETMEILSVESLFPFGFLRKKSGGSLQQEVWVWPARVEYEFKPPSSRQPRLSGEIRRKPGGGSDLLGLRPYRPGDPPRFVHWKASARLRELVVRQTGEEQQAGYHLVLDPAKTLWTDAAQFERVCSFAASLAEDLFMASQLRAVTIRGAATQTVTRLADLQGFFDQLARLTPDEHVTARSPEGHDVITFQPGARQQVHAYLGGILAGTA
ncbi:MAG TPA: DUF58 domain-containing protein [Opitutales bacterium]|nr:DUF58 domain-containing protein [Opitutales bacterium]